MTKEKRFLDALRDLFIGAKVDGQSGYINLMRIKAAYFEKIVEPALMADVDKALGSYLDFREELFDKLHAFFSRYFSRSGSICFAYTPQHMSVYEKVYSDEQDTILFWKTHMLYYVKTDRIFRDLKVTVEDQIFFFDCTALEHKKANEKRELVFTFQGLEKDGAIRLAVTHSERGRQTKDDEILKTLKKSGHPVKELVLEKAMSVFGRQSEVDYFINKDARGFLREQFDLWMYQYLFKDGTSWTQPRIRQLQSLKDIALKLIDFIAQFEDELVRIWNKPKFVRGSHYIITLDRIAARESGVDLLADLIKHKGMAAQVAEWQELSIVAASFKAGAILEGKGKDRKLADAWRSLPLDTIHFKSLELRLLGLFDDLDAAIDGRLIKSDNYQGLKMFGTKFRETVRCIYIDPPYNTDADDFPYVDSYRDASWICMMEDRLALAQKYLVKNGAIFASIDARERRNLEAVLDKTFGHDNRVEEIIWVQNTTKNQSPTYSTNHEYVEVYAKDLEQAKLDKRMFREPKPGYAEIVETLERLNPSFPPIHEIETAITGLFSQHRAEVSQELSQRGLEYASKHDPWKGLFNYCNAEYRDDSGRYVAPDKARAMQARLWVWRESDPSMSQVKEDSQKSCFRDPSDPTFRFFRPLHPTTKKPCPHPTRGWAWPMNPQEGQSFCFSSLAADNRIAWGKTEATVPQKKTFLHEVDTNVAKSVIEDFTDGEKELADLTGRTRSFPNPKPTTLIRRFLEQTTCSNEWVMDFFAGSGTTAHAVARAMQLDGMRRRFVLMDAAAHFDSFLVPRVKKVFAAGQWKEGKPVTLNGPGLFCKVCRLEQYEEAVANAAYAGHDDDLFRNTKTDPYSQYVFFQDSKMARAIELDYKKDSVDVHLDRLYPDIDLAETLSCVTGKWIKRITADEVEFADGTRQSLTKPDWRLLKPLIFWGPVV